MKRKFALMAVTVASTIGTCMAPAFADVIRPDGQTTGRPVIVESNTGSAQALENRSATGTQNKFANDGARVVWN